jgi:hypothetical protein
MTSGFLLEQNRSAACQSFDDQQSRGGNSKNHGRTAKESQCKTLSLERLVGLFKRAFKLIDLLLASLGNAGGFLNLLLEICHATVEHAVLRLQLAPQIKNAGQNAEANVAQPFRRANGNHEAGVAFRVDNHQHAIGHDSCLGAEAGGHE